MKAELKTMKQRLATFALLCVIMAIATGAFAVPRNEALRIRTNRTITGRCCFSWGESVTVTEPTTVVPVVVTWSTNYMSDDAFHVGISVNGQACQFFGPDFIQRFEAALDFESSAFQWIILPSDGLIKGTNTLTLCGGAVTQDEGALVLSFQTLAVALSD